MRNKSRNPQGAGQHRTIEDRRDEIIDRRLARALMGTGAAAATGAASLLVDKPTGKWLLGAAFVVLAVSGVAMIKTAIRSNRARRTRK